MPIPDDDPYAYYSDGRPKKLYYLGEGLLNYKFVMLIAIIFFMLFALLAAIYFNEHTTRKQKCEEFQYFLPIYSQFLVDADHFITKDANRNVVDLSEAYLQIQLAAPEGVHVFATRLMNEIGNINISDKEPADGEILRKIRQTRSDFIRAVQETNGCRR